jgi:toxin YoeB
MRNTLFKPDALAQLLEWSRSDTKILKKIIELSESASKTPFTGIGKPKPLKGNLQGKWSRRITDEHRLIYEVTDKDIIVLSCKGHYE